MAKNLFTLNRIKERGPIIKTNNRLLAPRSLRKLKFLYTKIKNSILQNIIYSTKNKYIILALFIFTILIITIVSYPIKNINILLGPTTLISDNDLQRYKQLLRNKPFFLLSSHKLALILKNADNRIASVYITKEWPGTVSINLKEKQYVSKININSQFYLISTDNNLFLIPKDLYNKVDLPEIYGANINKIKILLPKITYCIDLINQTTKKNNIPIKIKKITIIMDKWHIPTIKLTVISKQPPTNKPKTVNILLSPQKPIKQQINYLTLFILGANRQKIPYNYIDLRFDRIIIK